MVKELLRGEELFLKPSHLQVGSTPLSSSFEVKSKPVGDSAPGLIMTFRMHTARSGKNVGPGISMLGQTEIGKN